MVSSSVVPKISSLSESNSSERISIYPGGEDNEGTKRKEP